MPESARCISSPIATSERAFVAPAACPDASFNVTNYLFSDAVHPTTEAHAALGEYLYAKLQE